MRRGVESRVVSMETELPLELLLTHTRAELERAVAGVDDARCAAGVQGPALAADAPRPTATPSCACGIAGRSSLNCWSASPSIPAACCRTGTSSTRASSCSARPTTPPSTSGRRSSITPTSPSATCARSSPAMLAIDWRPWLDALASRSGLLLRQRLRRRVPEAEPDARAARVVRGRARPAWPRRRSGPRRPAAGSTARRAPPLVFAALDEKVLWGDLADVLHLIVAFAGAPGVAGRRRRWPPCATSLVRAALRRRSTWPATLGGRVGFLSPEFQALMLEIWKVKFLQIPRLNDVIRSTAGRPPRPLPRTTATRPTSRSRSTSATSIASARWPWRRTREPDTTPPVADRRPPACSRSAGRAAAGRGPGAGHRRRRHGRAERRRRGAVHAAEHAERRGARRDHRARQLVDGERHGGGLAAARTDRAHRHPGVHGRARAADGQPPAVARGRGAALGPVRVPRRLRAAASRVVSGARPRAGASATRRPSPPPSTPSTSSSGPSRPIPTR